MLYGERMIDICNKLGIDEDRLPDRLHSTLLDEIYNRVGSVTDRTVSGESVTINDISPVEQKVSVKVKSKNLIKYPFGQTSYTNNGVTFTVNENEQTLTVQGTPTKNTSFFYSYGNSRFCKIEKGKTYTLSCNSLLSKSRGYIFLQVINGETTYNNISVMNGNKTFIATGDGYAEIGIVVIKDVVYDETISTQLEEGDTATEYTPYVDVTDVTVTVCGEDENDRAKTYTPNAKGIVSGVTSVAPTMNIFTDTEGVNIEVKYTRDFDEVVKDANGQ